MKRWVWVIGICWAGLECLAGHWRGASQTGAFPGEELPDQWSVSGENLRWHAPYGSRSTPLAVGDRVYLIHRAGEGKQLQERVMALDLKTGERLWEHRFNVFLTDIVALRVGWANVATDPETGWVYAHGVQGLFYAFDPDGHVQWSRSLTEEFGRISGYGGRTNSPLVIGDLVLISFLNSSWGAQGRGLHRFLAMDKRTGDVVYWAEPSERPLDTTYSMPVVHEVDGKPMLFTGLADGSIVALDPFTGRRHWRFVLSKRGINSSVVVGNGKVYASHSEENLDTVQMGRVVCLDARTGTEVWRVDGIPAGYASPVLQDGLLYVPDNSANLHCLDAATGEAYWEFNYGNEAKGSPVYADGKIYVGEVAGSYHILAVSKASCRRLHQVNFVEPDGSPIEIFGTPFVAGNAVLLPTRTDLYCIASDGAFQPAEDDSTVWQPPDTLRLRPAEAWVGAGEELAFRVDEGLGQERRAEEARAEDGAVFGLTGLSGNISADGVFVSEATGRVEAGLVSATLGDSEWTSRVRVIPALPYREDFEGLPVGQAPPGYITSPLKTQIDTFEGGRVLRKLADRPAPPFARLRCYMMPPMETGYTVKADLFGVSKKKRFIPDMGLINSRYLLILTGTSERNRTLRLVSWAPVPRIQQDVPFDWQADRWYRVSLRVDVADGRGMVRGKVWPRGEAEPAAWSIEMTDPSPNPAGSPGLYAYSVGITETSKGTEVLFDNVEVYRNE